MKKLLSLLLLCMLLLSLSSVAFAEPVSTVTFEGDGCPANVFNGDRCACEARTTFS